MSVNTEFPARTAGDVTLPDGTVVFVCTLNTLLREQAEAKARRYAANECRGFLKGGTDYPAVVAQVRAMDAETQATYLAQQEYWSIQQEADGKYPEPMEPDQGEMDPEAYGKALVKWEAEKKDAEQKRKKFVETRHAAEVKRSAALTAKVREDRCVTAYHNNEWAQAYVTRLRIETLYRATRRNDDHSQKFFSSPEEYEDADDGVQNALHDFYYETLAIPPSEAIPTSPAAS